MGQPFWLGDWKVDPSSGEIERAGQRTALPPRAMEALRYLAARPQQVVSANELLDAVWRGAEVAPSAVYQVVLQLRKAFGDDAAAPTVIENIPRRGYRLIAPVLAESPPLPAPHGSEPPLAAPTRPARVRSWRLALFGIAVAALVGVFTTRQHWLPSVAASPIEQPPSITVLPFHASPTDTGLAYLADGLTDEVITTLGQLPGVTVTGRTSSFALRNTSASPAELGRMLGVRFLLEGRLRSMEGRMLIDTALVSTQTGAQLWSASYNVGDYDLPGLQRDIAVAVARSLNVLLSSDVSERLARRAMRDPAVFERYLRGRYDWNRRNRNSLPVARAWLEQAAALDPQDANVQIALAELYSVLPLYGVATPRVAFPLAKQAATRALQLDPERGEAHAILGAIRHGFDHDWPGAEVEFRAALAANPRHATSLQWYSEFLSYSRRFAEAEEQIVIAQAVDPVSPTIAVLRGSPALWAGQFDRAAEHYRAALQRAPEFPLAHYSLGLALLGAGRLPDAISELRRAEADLGSAFVAPSLAHALARSGDTDYARVQLAALSASAATGFVSPYKLAVLHAALGETSAALDRLEEAEQLGDDRLTLLAVDPLLNSLRREPRFADLLRRVGPPPHT